MIATGIHQHALNPPTIAGYEPMSHKVLEILEWQGGRVNSHRASVKAVVEPMVMLSFIVMMDFMLLLLLQRRQRRL